MGKMQIVNCNEIILICKICRKDWHVFSGNEIGALLGYWQLHIYTTKFKMDRSDLVFVNSAISSKMLRSMARNGERKF